MVSPAFNHTREDSPLTPCPQCAALLERARCVRELEVALHAELDYYAPIGLQKAIAVLKGEIDV